MTLHLRTTRTTQKPVFILLIAPNNTSVTCKNAEATMLKLLAEADGPCIPVMHGMCVCGTQAIFYQYDRKRRNVFPKPQGQVHFDLDLATERRRSLHESHWRGQADVPKNHTWPGGSSFSWHWWSLISPLVRFLCSSFTYWLSFNPNVFQSTSMNHNTPLQTVYCSYLISFPILKTSLQIKSICLLKLSQSRFLPHTSVFRVQFPSSSSSSLS